MSVCRATEEKLFVKKSHGDMIKRADFACPACNHPFSAFYQRGILNYRDGCGHFLEMRDGGYHGVFFVFRKG